MKDAVVCLTWEPSVSRDVINQKLLVQADQDVILVDEILLPTVNSYEFIATEGTNVHVVLVANDGSYLSIATTLDIVIPDLTEPIAPTGLSWEIVDVISVEESDEKEMKKIDY